MAINIGLTVQWPDGTAGTILREAISRSREDRPFLAPDDALIVRDALIVTLLAKREGHQDIRGTLRHTDEARLRLPGDSDVAKSNAVGAKLAEYVKRHWLQDGFSCRVDVDDLGIQFLCADPSS